MQAGPAGRKPKRRRMERLEGWGRGTRQEEDKTWLEQDQSCTKEDRMAGTDRVNTEKRCKQQSIQEWTLTDRDKQAKNVPEGRKSESKPITITKRRTKGKLTKNSQQ